MKKLVKFLTFFISILFIITLFASCEKTEKEISGDSSLKIINKCSFSISIYFDNDFIGKVEKESNRTWSVPTGKHEVRASSVAAGTTTENPTFYSGQIIIITISVGGAKSGEDVPCLMFIEQTG